MEYEDAGRGRPLVLLHGFPLTQAMWQPQIAALQGGYRVIAPSLRGFGGTDAFTGTPSMDQMADDVAALLDQLSIREPITLGGLSMGGYVVLAFARRHAARLRALILADTRSGPDSAEGKANRDRVIAFMHDHSAADLLEDMLPKLVNAETRTHRPAVVAEIRRIAASQSPAAIIAALQALRDRPDSTPLLSQISVPTLVLIGSDDTLTPPAAADELAAGITGARRVTIPDAGHLSNLEQPEHFNQEIRAFLEALPG